MDTYLNMLILSMYESPTNTGQIHNVLIGRSTPSILFVVELKRWHKYYGILANIARSRINSLHHYFLKERLIEARDDKFILTQKGKSSLRQFFSDHLLPFDDGNYYNHRYYESAWQLIQFISQVVSEKTYSNKAYIPLKKDLKSQLFVKSLKKQTADFEEKWIEEQLHVFSKIDHNHARILANSMVGHKTNGLTLKQIASGLELSNSEAYFNQLEAYKYYFAIVAREANLNLHQKIYTFADISANHNLTLSAFESLNKLRQGYTIDQIARARGIKAGTVKEHLLEIAFKMPQLNLSALIPDAIIIDLQNFFKHQKERSFKKAAEQIEKLEFYQYRIVELEEMRQ